MLGGDAPRFLGPGSGLSPSIRSDGISKERRAYRITGQVQGVGYRNFTRHRARDLDLKGWVCNRADGSVEVQVEGRREQLETFEGWLREGPPAGHVEGIEPLAAEGREKYQDFEIRFG
jgi:acylphosphatase